MAITPLTTDLNHVQALNDRPNANSGMTADQVKEAFDKSGNDIKGYINNTMIPDIGTTFVSSADLTTNRKLSASGDFTGTINGYPIVMSNPGLATEFAALQAAIAAQKVVNVEDFSGVNDLIKIQAAFDYAIAHSIKIVEFTKKYDISGLGAIKLIKAYPYQGTLFIVGRGGGITKNDAGYIFQNPALTARMSDFNVTGMSFESNNAATVTNVWDLDYFLRINSSYNFYNGIDSGFRTDTSLAQSIRADHETVRGGNGYFVYCFTMGDTTIEDCLIENRSSGWGFSGGGISNTGMSTLTGGLSNFNIRIINNVIEGCDLAGVKLGNCISSLINGNYMESNGSYFDLVTYLSAANYHNGLTFSGNHVQQTTAQVAANVPALDITNILGHSGSDFKQQANCSFFGNRALGLLYKVTGNYYVNSLGDYAAGTWCSPMTQLILPAGLNFLPVNGGLGALATVKTGIIYSYFKVQSVTLTANELKTQSITITNAYFAAPISPYSLFEIECSNITDVRIYAKNFVATSTNVATVSVRLENMTAGSVTFNLTIKVMNPGD